MFGIKLSEKEKQKRGVRFYKCTRCGYISTSKGTDCPICIKDGIINKMK